MVKKCHTHSFINNEYDFKRTEVLQNLGYKVIRFSNDVVFKKIDLVLEALKQEFKR